MRRAICRIQGRDHVLIDGLRVHRLEDHVGPYTAIVRGDAKCYSIAAASIVAKVVRDRLMKRLDRSFPLYGFSTNVGYRSPAHLKALNAHGPCVYHRRSFAPVKMVSES
jgi:ribonuclease HII